MYTFERWPGILEDHSESLVTWRLFHRVSPPDGWELVDWHIDMFFEQHSHWSKGWVKKTNTISNLFINVHIHLFLIVSLIQGTIYIHWNLPIRKWNIIYICIYIYINWEVSIGKVSLYWSIGNYMKLANFFWLFKERMSTWCLSRLGSQQTWTREDMCASYLSWNCQQVCLYIYMWFQKGVVRHMCFSCFQCFSTSVLAKGMECLQVGILEKGHAER